MKGLNSTDTLFFEMSGRKKQVSHGRGVHDSQLSNAATSLNSPDGENTEDMING